MDPYNVVSRNVEWHARRALDRKHERLEVGTTFKRDVWDRDPLKSDRVTGPYLQDRERIVDQEVRDDLTHQPLARNLPIRMIDQFLTGVIGLTFVVLPVIQQNFKGTLRNVLRNEIHHGSESALTTV